MTTKTVFEVRQGTKAKFVILEDGRRVDGHPTFSSRERAETYADKANDPRRQAAARMAAELFNRKG